MSLWFRKKIQTVSWQAELTQHYRLPMQKTNTSLMPLVQFTVV